MGGAQRTTARSRSRSADHTSTLRARAVTPSHGAASLREMSRARPRPVLGRERELAQLTQLLEDGASLVTVLGPGGMGKTTLVRQLAEQGRAAGRRVWWVDLEAAHTTDALAAALREVAQPGAPAEELTDEVLDRAWADVGELWIVLDNLEQLLPEAAPQLARWHDRAPEVAWIITSRQTLRLSPEVVLELGPLALDAAALALMTDRVARQRPGWQPSAAEALALRRIVARLDGVPLALELAAPRARTLSLEALAAQLEHDLSLLDHGPHDLPDRHRTIDAAIASSVARLGPEDREALWAAACFRAPFEASALAEVLGSPADGLRRAHDLRERSLLAEAAPGVLSLYTPVHDHLRRHGPPAAVASALAARHAAYVLAEAEAGRIRREDLAEVVVRAARPEYARDAEAHAQALRAACALSLRELGLSEGSTLEHALAQVLERAPALGTSPELCAQARAARGELAWTRGLHALACAELEAALRALGPGPERLHALIVLARARFGADLLEAALVALVEALPLARALGDTAREARVLHTFGAVRQSLGRRTEAQADLEAALRLARQLGHRELEAHAEGSLGVLMLDEGRLEAARARLRHAALLAAETGQTRTREVLSSYVALSLLEAGELVEAEQWLGYALSSAQRTHNVLHSANHSALLGAVAASRGQLEQAERSFAEAELGLRGLSPWAEVARVHRGHLHLARARRARAEGQVVVREQELTLAEGCLRVADSPTRLSSDDLRIAARILERALLGATQVDTPPSEVPARTALMLGDGLRWFSVAGGERVDLARRPLLRSLLGALAEQHEARPGAVVERPALIARAWPGERYNPEVHVNRLNVALSTLRTLGLRELLERNERGYRLDPRIEVHRMAPLPRP